MNESGPRRVHDSEPADVAIGLGFSLTALFVGLLALLVRAQLASALLGVWPVLLAAALMLRIGRDAVVPVNSSALRQIAGAALSFSVELLAVLPLVALGWELGGLRLLGAALGAMLLGVCSLIVWAIEKPSLELEPGDLLIVPGLMIGSAFVAVMVVGLPIGWTLAAVLVAPTMVVFLGMIAELLYCTHEGEQFAAGVRMCSWMVGIAVQYVLLFVQLAR